MKTVLAVTGGISAYKSAFLARLMIKKGWEVKTVMSESARQFITPLTFQTLTLNPVYTDIFPEQFNYSHISLSQWADFIVVAPATANTLAKIAGGLADNLLTSLILDFRGKVFLCPAMHRGMWKAPATCENIKILKERGFLMIGPDKGALACGDEGRGRMSDPGDILKYMDRELNNTAG